MSIVDTGDLWWKSAVVYCLDVETYLDWNGDGVGDFAGLAHRIDYLAELGVTCLWLMPFYPTAGRDDGYDIVDFYAVDPRFGHFGDFVELIRLARSSGLRVIVDLVINHTSDQHPWFEASRSSRDSPFRDYYVWRDKPPKKQPKPVFPDQESSNWELDTKTGQYYQHMFYKAQPDLNVANPAVRDEIAKIMGFWVELGVNDFRVDAVPFLLETVDIIGGDGALPDPHAYLKSLRSFLSRRIGDGILLGEVNLPRAEQLTFFGGPDGDELNMQFDFISMQKMYLSLARGDTAPLVEALQSRPDGTHDVQWANFARNHDELTLDKLTDDERAEVFAAFGPEERMQVFGRGIVRRLPTMLSGDQRRIRMVYSLLFAMPGTPVLFYGEEIGMGENLAREGRMAVRTPMQWNAGRNGGFSNAEKSPLIDAMVDGVFGPDRVNVEDQLRDPGSQLGFIKKLIEHYRASPELGWGTFELLKQQHPSVLAHTLAWDGGRVLLLHNFADEPLDVHLAVPDGDGGTSLSDLFSDETTALADDGTVDLPLEGYGFRWLRLVSETDVRRY
ncbi:alpha-amylase family protein [Glaciibacter sp. 2TAF33]|uniref:alpha-amylase family protein n=1 Tax=Glaciibacter sp. 2TAF33 TaxID=3233015 RepID=UPI003F91ADEA